MVVQRLGQPQVGEPAGHQRLAAAHGDGAEGEPGGEAVALPVAAVLGLGARRPGELPEADLDHPAVARVPVQQAQAHQGGHLQGRQDRAHWGHTTPEH